MTVLHDDPYTVLGVARDADQAAIRRAYRRLAKESHPDLHPGDTSAEDRFRKLNTAYDILGDPDRRARFDRGEIGPDGADRAPFADGFAGQAGAGPGDFTFRWRASGGGTDGGRAGFEGVSDIFADLFGQGPTAGRTPPRRRGDIRSTLAVDFTEMALGARKTIRLPDGKTVALRIPAGVEDGQILRLKGKGRPGPGGAPAGDLLVTVTVRPDARFRRDGLDIHLDLPIGLREAVLGGPVTVPTPGGAVSARVPPRSSSGRKLRLKGKGIHKDGRQGDLYARLMITLPAAPDARLEEFMRSWPGDATPSGADGR